MSNPSLLPLGIGLVGLGRWGSNYARTLLTLPECRLIAAADTNPAARTRAGLELGIAVRASFEELLADTSVTALCIATPDRTHFRLASEALAAGRDVLVEKPMALEPDEAETLAGQAEAGRRVLAVGHTAVYDPGFMALMNGLAAEPLRPRRQASAVRTSRGYTDGRSNPIYDLCPHDLAMAVLLFGSPVAARASCVRTGVEYEVRFAGDALLHGQAEWREPPHTRRFEVAGPGGQTELSDLTGSGNLAGDVRNSPLGRQCLDFIACCCSRRQPLSNGQLGLEVTRCLAAMATSCADSSEWVPLTGVVRRPPSARNCVPVA